MKRDVIGRLRMAPPLSREWTGAEVEVFGTDQLLQRIDEIERRLKTAEEKLNASQNQKATAVHGHVC